MAQIELKDIVKTFRVGETSIEAVKGTNLSIEKGEFISIIGHSGSGKTTLLSVIGGILGPSSGRYLFEGADVYSLGKDDLARYRADSVGFVFQFASLMPVLTATENLILPTIFGTNPPKDPKARAEELLGLVGLGDKLGSYPAELSGGQQRRVAIARSLMNSPKVILADEPTGDLDEDTEAEVMGLFKKVNKEQGITFVLVTHNRELAREAGRTIKMTNGRIEA